ncbi:MAG: hypothetical protein VX822_00780 [Candidatus Neomarinimicrobiota bacterium]|nr:hypothetical protein [Candidatus Neomarinimicrobiota bacterium]
MRAKVLILVTISLNLISAKGYFSAEEFKDRRSRLARKIEPGSDLLLRYDGDIQNDPWDHTIPRYKDFIKNI